MQHLQNLWWDALALVWPVACVGCGRNDRELCRPCRARVRAVVPEHAPFGRIDAISGGPYRGVVRQALIACKHAGATGLVAALGDRFAVVLRAALDSADLAHAAAAEPDPAPPLIIAVPSRRERVRRRGYHHLDLLVRRALRVLGRANTRGGGDRRLPVRCSALVAARGRTGQVGLNAAERERNAARVRVKRHRRTRVAGHRVILVDDIMTTGATARACIAVLEAAGARVIAVTTLCRVERKDTRGEIEVESQNQYPVKFEAGVTVRHTGAPA